MIEDVTLNEAAGFFEIRVTGEVETSEILGVIRRLLTTDAYAAVSGAVWDFREADLSSLTLDGMRQVWSAEAAVLLRDDLRVASVFSHAQDGLILHLWQSAGGGFVGMDRRSFNDIEAARRWVGGDQAANGGRDPADPFR